MLYTQYTKCRMYNPSQNLSRTGAPWYEPMHLPLYNRAFRSATTPSELHHQDPFTKATWSCLLIMHCSRSRTCSSDGKKYSVLVKGNSQGPPGQAECRCKDAVAGSSSGGDVSGFGVVQVTTYCTVHSGSANHRDAVISGQPLSSYAVTK